MGHRYGVSIGHYGKMSWAIAELQRELGRRGVPILDIRGAPYPEMARAEQVRRARVDGVGTLVFIDSHVSVSVGAIEQLVSAAEAHGMALPQPDSPYALEFAAVTSRVLEAMVQAEARRYENSCVDVMWGSEKIPSVPVASPWHRDGSSLEPGMYLTDSQAFVHRARETGAVVAELWPDGYFTSRKRIRTSAENLNAPVTHEPGSRYALCIPSFGGIDIDQQTMVFQLEKAGMTVLRIHDCPWIDLARSWLAETAMSVGKGCFFLDHDIIFHANDVLRLCEQGLDKNAVVAGVYCMRRSGKNLIGSFDVKPGPMTFFKNGSTLPAFYSGLGFAAVPYDVLAGIELRPLHSVALYQQAVQLHRVRPWFGLDCSTGFYAGEDVSFCNRVHDLAVRLRDAGGPGLEPQWEMSHSGRPARVFLDSRVRIAHRGEYDYGIEDAGAVVPRIEELTTYAVASRAEARARLLNVVDDIPLDVQLASRQFAEDQEKPFEAAS